VSVYAVQQAIFDHLRALEVVGRDVDPASIDGDSYGVTAEEARSLREGDVAAWHLMGVHPVLIDAWCRANGWRGPSYRLLFGDAAGESPRRARWQRSCRLTAPRTPR
jgi:hypothetical protein